MSGGSYNYLFRRGLSKDSQVRPDIEAMAERLERTGYPEAAKATGDILRLADALAEVWRTVEWADSGDADEWEVQEAVTRFEELSR